ncbi:RNA polymerase sigma factor [Sphingopyxis sp. MWB1]|uniref:RNA polymerase sigma factor n=1 Tax=Sphingopyxis sp. MWB1 TaxID=1537715 RepID=UPI00068C56BE|nr:sigma-70 family RNA polymerase sigma factor [Sphingopyxis sp. MWB1]
MQALERQYLTMAAPRPDPDLEAWITAYAPGLRSFFRRRAPEADVDDLVQDVFLRLQAARFAAPIDNVEGYLFATARNVLASRYRKQAAHKSALSQAWLPGYEIGDPLSPERIAIGQDEYRRVVQAIVNLPPRARQAFELHRFEHMTYQAIARRMGISKHSVKELMHRALTRIAEEMEMDP